MSDFFFAHSDFLHDLVAFSVIIPFRYLFVVDDECRCHQEYDSEEDTDEEKPTVKFINFLCLILYFQWNNSQIFSEAVSEYFFLFLHDLLCFRLN